MTITKFRETNKDRAVTLPLSIINLTETCHKKALEKNSKVSKLTAEPMCIVRENEDGTYDLIIGYRDYITAKNSEAEEVKAIIIPDKSRNRFLKSLDMTFEMYEVEKIHPPKGWIPPATEKIQSCKESYELTGTFGKPIVISPDGTILDGYAAVCAAQAVRAKKIPVYILSTQRWNKLPKNKRRKFLKTP